MSALSRSIAKLALLAALVASLSAGCTVVYPSVEIERRQRVVTLGLDYEPGAMSTQEGFETIGAFLAQRGLKRTPSEFDKRGADYGRGNMWVKTSTASGESSCINVEFVIAPDSGDYRAVHEERDAFVTAFSHREPWDLIDGGCYVGS